MTDASPTYPDAGHDPIASESQPFAGSFVTTGMISANPALSSIGAYFNALDWSLYAKHNARVEGFLWADSIYTPSLTADDVLVNVINISSYELNGFTISGSDFNLEIPNPPFPFDEKLLLSGVQLSGTGWASFQGSIYTNLNLYVANSAAINLLSAHDTTINGDLIVTDDASIGNDLSVYGDLYISGSETLSGDLIINGDVSAHDLIATNNLYVSGDAWIHTLNLSGDCTIMGTVTSEGIMTSTGEFLYLRLNSLDRYIPLYTIS